MRPSIKPLPLKWALDQSSPNYQILVLKKKAGVDFNQFLMLSAISHSPLKLFKVQTSKAYGKVGRPRPPQPPRFRWPCTLTDQNGNQKWKSLTIECCRRVNQRGKYINGHQFWNCGQVSVRSIRWSENPDHWKLTNEWVCLNPQRMCELWRKFAMLALSRSGNMDQRRYP